MASEYLSLFARRIDMKILVIDDDKMICFALKTIIESQSDFEVVGIGHNFDDAINMYDLYNPDIALFDIRIGEKNGIDAFKHIKSKYPDSKVIFLTTFLDENYISEAINLGSSGYLLKDDFESICPSIRAVYAGQTVFGTKVISNIGNINKNNNKDYNREILSELSEREIDILKLVADGLNNKEIANKLYLSEGTVRNYISSMLVKLNLRDRTQLAIFYLR